MQSWSQLCQSESLTVAENAARCLLSLAEGGTLCLCFPLLSTPLGGFCDVSTPHQPTNIKTKRRTSTRSAPWAWVRKHLTLPAQPCRSAHVITGVSVARRHLHHQPGHHPLRCGDQLMQTSRQARTDRYPSASIPHFRPCLHLTDACALALADNRELMRSRGGLAALINCLKREVRQTKNATPLLMHMVV